MSKVVSIHRGATKEPAIECLVCVEQCTELKVLPCSSDHAFCAECLKKCGEYNSLNKIQCPLCRKSCTLPKNGIPGLPDKKPCARSDAEEAYCDVCTGPKETIEATGFCTECKEQLCQNCCMRHGRQKYSKDHRLLTSST